MGKPDTRNSIVDSNRLSESHAIKQIAWLGVTSSVSCTKLVLVRRIESCSSMCMGSNPGHRIIQSDTCYLKLFCDDGGSR